MSNETVVIADLMGVSGVGFGTSGARGLVADMTDRVCYAYTLGFLQHLAERDGLPAGHQVALAGDFRPSTPRIMAACARAIADFGCEPLNCGYIPSPAIALFGIARQIPALMVTGSHIPDDRNGIKFNKADGEILKEDEAGIRAQQVEIPGDLFDAAGALREPYPLPAVELAAYEYYLQRYLRFFDAGCLSGVKLGLYEHSSVARQLLGEVLEQLGAEVVRLGYSERFIPVDTEAIRPEDAALAAAWAAESGFDAIVSTDGDGDRPLISDERGNWLRGDVVGILCARYLGARQVVTPVSSNSAVEQCGWFDAVTRTRIGSPYVIAGMRQALEEGPTVVGYEANGGFLTADDFLRDGRLLPALPTRDALLPILSLLCAARQEGCAISGLLEQLPRRFTASGRIRNFPTEISRALINRLQHSDPGQEREAIDTAFGRAFGGAAATDKTDGLRITFINSEVVHLRPSGNAPELRCYCEADSEARASAMVDVVLDILAELSATST